MKRGGPLKRTTGLKRSQLQQGSSQIKRSAPPKRRTPVKQINRKRRARLRAEQFGIQADLCRTLPCCACRASAPSDPAHVRSRGAGGKDRGNVVSLCRLCHTYQHDHGWKELAKARGLSPGFELEVAAELESRAYP